MEESLLTDVLTRSRNTTITVDDSGVKIGVGSVVMRGKLPFFNYKWVTAPDLIEAFKRAKDILDKS